ALDRSLQYMLAVADMGSGAPEFFQEMHETAKRMHEADPGNAVAEVAVQTSVIRPWLRGVEVDPQRLAETMEAMAKLIEKYPDNAELPFYLAHANLRQAELARERRDMTERSRKIAEAVKIVDEAVARSTSAAMYFSAGQIAGALEGYDAPDKREQWR